MRGKQGSPTPEKMMDFLRDLEAKKTGRCSPMDDGPMAIVELSEGTDPQPSGFGVSHEYRYSANIGVMFRANKAQMEHALKEARIRLHQILFADFENGLREMREAIYAGDRKNALRASDKLISLCRGETNGKTRS